MNRPVFQMSSSEDEALSPETGASAATDPVLPMLQMDSESDDGGEHAGKKKRTLRKDTRPWERVAMFEKGVGAVHDAEEIKK